MKSWKVLALSAAALAGFGPAATAQSAASETPTATPGPQREINVTHDSAPGWLPSAAFEEQVRKRTSEYFSDLDSEQYQRAYAMMAEINREDRPLATFIQENQGFHDRAGALTALTILKITWTKDPAKAPLPGIYAAIDIAGHFQKMDRYCGYLVLYKAPIGGEFEVMRQEANYMDDAQAAKIEREKSRAAVDTIWAALATYCPNYQAATQPRSP